MGPSEGNSQQRGHGFRDHPFDEFALEEALLTKEKYHAEVVAITMGPAKATDVLKNALALEVDSVYHVTIRPSQAPTPSPLPMPWQRP